MVDDRQDEALAQFAKAAKLGLTPSKRAELRRLRGYKGMVFRTGKRAGSLTEETESLEFGGA